MPLTVGYFRYEPGVNPFQRLFAEALESAGLAVDRIPPRKWFALQSALRRPIDALQVDWPDTLFTGRNPLNTGVKRLMYRDGLRRLEGVPLVWTVHNIVGHDAPDAAGRLRETQLLVDRCRGIVVMSGAARALLERSYRLAARTIVAVIPHGHYIDAYRNAVSREEARRRLSLGERGRVVLFLGSLQPYKGAEELIEAFAAVAAPGDALLLAGPAPDPAYGERLRSLAAGRASAGAEIRIAPAAVPDDELQVYFNAADIAALPFRAILNSGSAILAQSFARCVVAPALGSLPEVLCPDGFFGYDPARPGALAETLRDALGRGDLAARGARAREFLRATCDWGIVGRKARELYERVAG